MGKEYILKSMETDLNTLEIGMAIEDDEKRHIVTTGCIDRIWNSIMELKGEKYEDDAHRQ